MRAVPVTVGTTIKNELMISRFEVLSYLGCGLIELLLQNTVTPFSSPTSTRPATIESTHILHTTQPFRCIFNILLQLNTHPHIYTVTDTALLFMQLRPSQLYFSHDFLTINDIRSRPKTGNRSAMGKTSRMCITLVSWEGIFLFICHFV